MKIQESWSHNTSLSGPFTDRQKTFSRPRYNHVYLYGKIVDIDPEQLSVKISFDKLELNEKYTGYYPLDINYSDFISTYGSIESFKELLSIKTIRCKLTYQPPNLLKGKIQIIEDYDRKYDQEHQSNSFSIGAIINGFSSSTNTIYSVIKPIYLKDSNTGIYFTDKTIRISTTGDRFLEINDAGSTISGPVNFQASPNQITFAGIVAFPGFFRGLIPSTVASPNPVYTPNIPDGLLKEIKDLAQLATIMIG